MCYGIDNMASVGKKLAIDFGSGNTRIYIPKKGVVLNQPTVIAKEEADDSIVAVGDQAIDMVGRSPDNLRVVRPLSSGVIADYDSAMQTLRLFLAQALGKFQLRKPDAMLTVSGSATSTERLALVDAAKDAGLADVHLIQGAVAASLGSGLPLNQARGNMIVDIGRGTTEIGVFSLGGIVTQNSVRRGGANIDEAISSYLRREHRMRVGNEAIFDIKAKFIDLSAKDNNKTYTVHGQSTLQGVPKTAQLKQGHLRPYVERSLDKSLIATKKVLEQTPPDLIADIIKHGVMISGGSCQLKGLADYMSKRLNIAFILSQDPMLASIKGANLAITHLEDYQKSLLT